MNTGTILLLLLVLACPLSMLFMHGRGGHGGHAHGSGSNAGDPAGNGHSQHGLSDRDRQSLDELRRRRSELDGEIRERETAGVDSPTR